MTKQKNASISLLVLYLLGTSVFNTAMALLFPVTDYYVSNLALPYLSEGTEKAYWLLDNHEDADYFADKTSPEPYRDYLLSMEADDRFSYIICIGQSIYPSTEALGDFLRGIVINQAAQNYFPVSIIEGRNFSPEDYLIDGQGDIPILIGTELAKSLSIGDSFHATFFRKDCIFRVIGILESGTTLYRLDQPIDMDDRVLIPAFFSAEDCNPFFEKALMQSYFDAVVIIPEATFSDFYALLWKTTQTYKINMVSFGRIAPLLQLFSYYRNQLGTILSLFLPLIFICLRLLIFFINISCEHKYSFLQCILLPIVDIAFYTLLFNFAFSVAYSFAIPWQYYFVECILCVTVFTWRRAYGKNV